MATDEPTQGTPTRGLASANALAADLERIVTCPSRRRTPGGGFPAHRPVEAQPGAPFGPTQDDHVARHGTPSRGRKLRSMPLWPATRQPRIRLIASTNIPGSRASNRGQVPARGVTADLRH